ncbi:vegetative cell wall protein gp1-like [Miscanthus floridulus]|uniref:vegetative cell wall protein gp1-like n=1 Tax=Miscanthus floridulus TaxID=154761 RepID=UPI00345B0EAB
MENVLLDRSSSRSLEFPKRFLGRSRRGPAGARPVVPGGGSYSSFPTWQPYNHLQKGGAWTSAPTLPYARSPTPMIYSSPSLPLLPSNQPPLLPLPPIATKYATFPGLPAAPPQPPPAPRAAGRAAAATTTVSAAAAPAPAPPRQRDRRRRPTRPPPPTMERSAPQKKPLERATPLPPAPVVTEALDDLEQEVARNFVQDLLHVLAPPPSSLPLPSFSLVVKASPARDTRLVAPAAPSCNVEAATADGIRGLLRL